MEFPSTLAGARAAVLIERLLRGEQPPEELMVNVPPLPPITPEIRYEGYASRLEGGEVRDVTSDGDHKVTVHVVTPNRRRWDVAIGVAEEPPHDINALRLIRLLPEGIHIRDAQPEDNDGIIAVCRATPIVTGDARVTIDPSPDYFAYLRLMEGSKSLVAIDGNRIVAVHSASIYTAGYGNRTQRMVQVLHSRVLPDYGGFGLFAFLNEQYGRWSYELNQRIAVKNVRAGKPPMSGEMLAGCGYVAVDNTAVVRGQQAPNAWKVRPFRVTVPCVGLAAASADDSGHPVRTATSADADAIVAVLNAMHEKESLYLPYTVESFTERLTRAADVYSWNNVYLAEGAVLGVWFAGHTRTKVTATATERSVRALVLDYGFTPGHEDAFHALIRAAARDGMATGTTHLSFFTSEPSPGSELLRKLGDNEEYYVFGTPFTEEPEGTAQHGMYVDQISF